MLCVVLGRTEDIATNIFVVQGGAQEPQTVGSWAGAGRQAAVGVAVFNVFSQDWFSSVLWSRSSMRTGWFSRMWTSL